MIKTPPFAWSALAICWFAWGYPFIFRAPHHQNRPSITVVGPTRVGLLFECVAILLAFVFRVPGGPGWIRVLPGVLLGIVAAVMAWGSVRHLGKQFRVHAGLYVDHELVTTGPYAVVRHPIYSSLLAMLLSSLLILTSWEWALVSVALFILGTEIRVRTEDQLLQSRFGDGFTKYQKQVRAYVPFIR